MIGRNLAFLGGESLFFFVCVLLLDGGAFNCVSRALQLNSQLESFRFPDHGEALDEDVSREAQRVASGGADGEALVVRNLCKVYPAASTLVQPKAAVRDLSVGIPQGQVFGFLGVNGAGKTSTLAMLTGDAAPTSGSAEVCSHSILTSMSDVRQLVGYCPQFDPLLGLMTGRETLAMFAKLRGVPEVADTVERALHLLGLADYADKQCAGYSGGNKRKLSLGIALKGNPSVIFLDEPSTGMDPAAKRFVWDLLTDIAQQSGCSIVLTTHSMEECEALCNRLAIMVNGRFRCIGSTQHLKSKFGKGYHLELKLGAGATAEGGEVQRLQAFVAQELPEATLQERHANSLKYMVPLVGTSLSRLFGLISDNKAALGIEVHALTHYSCTYSLTHPPTHSLSQDFSVSQASLEQIFCDIAKDQEEDLRQE